MTLQEKDLKNVGFKIQEMYILYRCKVLDQIGIQIYFLTYLKIRDAMCEEVQYQTQLKFKTQILFNSYKSIGLN